jgi:hypothetical protein
VAAIGQAANGLADLPYRWRRIRILRVVHGQRLLTSVPGSFEESPQAEMPRCMSTAAA